MIIRLPERFIYSNKGHEDGAYVENGILYMSKYTNFEDLMYTITYVLKGYDRCCYCGEKLTIRSRTLDHMYPRRWGGVSIPENLLPSCKKCNQDKKDMTYRQFQEWRKLETQGEKEKYYQQTLVRNLDVARRGRFVIKRRWLSAYEFENVAKYISFNRLSEKKSKLVSSYYRNWGQYPHPIIVSSNGWIIKGLHVLHHAKKQKKKHVMAIVLENVVVYDKDTP